MRIPYLGSSNSSLKLVMCITHFQYEPQFCFIGYEENIISRITRAMTSPVYRVILMVLWECRFLIYLTLIQTWQKRLVKPPRLWTAHLSVSFLDKKGIKTMSKHLSWSSLAIGFLLQALQSAGLYRKPRFVTSRFYNGLKLCQIFVNRWKLCLEEQPLMTCSPLTRIRTLLHYFVC